MGLKCLKATELLQGDSLLFTTQSPGDFGTYLIDLRRMKDHCALITWPLYPLLHWSQPIRPLLPNIFSKRLKLRQYGF